MNNIEELYNALRTEDDTTMSSLVQDAITLLVKRAAIRWKTPLGDNVLELISDELQNAFVDGELSSQLTVLNMFAAPAAQVGSLNPFDSARRYLNALKSGKDVAILPENVRTFPAEFGTVIRASSLTGILITEYSCDEHKVIGGFPGILDVWKSIEAGVLIFQREDETPEKCSFTSISPAVFKHLQDDSTAEILRYDERQELAQELLTQAAEVLESGKPEFVYSIESCSPPPNYMNASQWTEIVAIIRARLT